MFTRTNFLDYSARCGFNREVQMQERTSRWSGNIGQTHCGQYFEADARAYFCIYFLGKHRFYLSDGWARELATASVR